MYAAHFNCREHPFHITPDPRFFYANDMYEEAYANLLYGVRERKGFLVLTGEVGTGKTTLLRRLMEELNSPVRFAFFYHTNLNFEEILEFLCQDFGLSVDPKASRLQRIQALNAFLLARLAEGGTGVLLIDEAQNLSDDALENLRLLSNLETSREKLLQIILVGQPELERKLVQPHLRQLKQRIVVWRRLGALAEREVGSFIRHRLQIAGCERDLFTPEAIQCIAFYAKGVPRLINVICDNALLTAYAASQPKVAAEVVEEVAQDLGLRERGRTPRWQLSSFPPIAPEEKPIAEEKSAPPKPPMSKKGDPASAVPPRSRPSAVDSPPTTDDTLLHKIAEAPSLPAARMQGQQQPLAAPLPPPFHPSHSRRPLLIAAVVLLLSLSLAFVFFQHSIGSFFPRLALVQRPQAPQTNIAPRDTETLQTGSALSVPPHDPSFFQPVEPPQKDVSPPPPSALPRPDEEPPPPSTEPASPSASAASPGRTALQAPIDPVVREAELAELPTKKQKRKQKDKAAVESPQTAASQSLWDEAAPQPAPEKVLSPSQKKEEQDNRSERATPSFDKREEALLELQIQGIAVDGPAVLASAERGDIDSLNLLLTAGVSPNAKDAKGWSALMMATMHGQAATARRLIAGGANVNDANDTGGTALMLAAVRGNQDIVQTLLSNGAAVNVKNREGWTPLMYAAWNGHVASVRTLIDKGADVNTSNQGGWTPLMCAAWKGHAAAVQALLTSDADANVRNKNNELASQLASRRGHSVIVQLLKPPDLTQ